MKLRLLPTLIALMISTASHLIGAAPMRVAMIFDDGPVPAHTARLLEILAREKIHVSFGTVASKAQAAPDSLRAVIKAGHEVTNHSFAHQHPAQLDDKALEQEIPGAQSVFIKEFGYTPAWYWPPFIEVDARVTAATAKAGIKVYPDAFNIVSSDDWNTNTDAAHLYKNATTGVHDGCVILFHEWRPETLEQLPAIIAELRRQGCVFMTFSELQVSKAAKAAK